MSNIKPEFVPASLVATGAQSQNSNNVQQTSRVDIAGQDLFSSVNLRADDDFQRSKVNFSGRLPGWLWSMITVALGIGKDRHPWRKFVSTSLQLLTIASALLFACCGLAFNVYDLMSGNSKTTLLIGICKTFLGAYWVGMGIYARSLAARLFSNALFVDCIRMHSKTIFKINTAVIIVVLSITVTMANMYWTRNLLQLNIPDPSTTPRFREGNCGSAGVNIILCQVYFGARLLYSGFNLLWNLLVASILLSVCRTHTICIRRFMRELLYDNKIYEEFMMLQTIGHRAPLVENNSGHRDSPNKMETILELNTWDNDMNEFDGDEKNNDGRPPSNACILNSIRNIRHSRCRSGVRSASQAIDSSGLSVSHTPSTALQIFPPESHGHQDIQLQFPGSVSSSVSTATSVNHPRGETTRQRYSSHTSTGDQTTSQLGPVVEEETRSIQSGQYYSALDTDEAFYRKALEEGKPPIMSNEEMLLTHFQLRRRLCSTSRLLQRWMLTIISFTLMWCALFVIYWTKYSASWLGLFEFVVPLVILYLLTTAYAEVNLEGERIVKFVLPTLERLNTVAYMRTSPPELKVFSYILTYNAIVTVVTGVAISFASSIVLKQIIK